MQDQARLGVLIIHGIGDDHGFTATRPGYSDGLQQALRRENIPASEVAFEEVFWHQHVQPRQDAYWELAKPLVRWDVLRSLVLDYLSDASTYRELPGRANSVYDNVHREVHRCLEALALRLADDAPLVVMAHSLGGHIMSNYIWDRQRESTGGEDPLGGTAFLRMERLASMVTFGCNLPLFVLASDPYLPITVPAPQLPAKLKQVGHWLNYYDKDDVLGWPLGPLRAFVAEDDRPAFDAMVEDVQVNVGIPLIQATNPLSHVGYWTDADFVKPVAEHLHRLLAAL